MSDFLTKEIIVAILKAKLRQETILDVKASSHKFGKTIITQKSIEEAAEAICGRQYLRPHAAPDLSERYVAILMEPEEEDYT
jgi:hypothetical protein